MSRLRFYLVAAGLCVLVILAAGCEMASAAQAAVPDCDPATIAVSGEADVRVVPDQVLLSLGVEVVNARLETAREENDRIVKGLLTLAESYGIEAQHVQTDHISIEPLWDDSYLRRNFRGYLVRKMVVVTLSDLESFEALLSDALGAGTTHVLGVEFRTTELRAHRDQARSLAIQAAREKALAMAAELDQTVGEPLHIQEDYVGWWSSYGSWWGSGWGGGMTQNVIQQSGAAAYTPDSAVAPGQISVRARVSVTFAIR